MAKKQTVKKTSAKPKKKIKIAISLSSKQRLVLGMLLLLSAIAVFISLCSYYFTWQYDQSQIDHLEEEVEVENLLQRFGAYIGNLLVFKGFGIMSFTFPVLIALSGISYMTKAGQQSLKKRWFWGMYLVLLGSVFFGFFTYLDGLLSGVVGFEINTYLRTYIGVVGTFLVVLFFLMTYLILCLELTPEKAYNFFKVQFSRLKNTSSSWSSSMGTKNIRAGVDRVRETVVSQLQQEEEIVEQEVEEQSISKVSTSVSIQKEVQEPFGKTDISTATSSVTKQSTVPSSEKFDTSTSTTKDPADNTLNLTVNSKDHIDTASTLSTKTISSNFEIEEVKEEEVVEETFEVNHSIEKEEDPNVISNKLVEDFGEYDHTLELQNYQYPTLDLLQDYANHSNTITIDQSELEENKNTIVETLKNYKIGIAHIKATIGPTVTLYEIVPEAGVRISKIKNLEDDIALSLAALGIRIIAPIPGKGTIGIEVPNKKSTIVSMRSSIAATKFQNTDMELPISFGKNISNETVVVDLAKMPHLLMAGATGQGKSVGLNCILTSLLYKKHPAEVKFVLVDPKKVELTLFNKIERHFLAKLPDTEDAIITDNAKVINTLNSLCIEMDDRYELLKNAYVRNIKEYNAKFKLRKLNPENGHRFLPYIVLVIDEFADLIMTAGKEVELPIARLAQLARAVGIHLIIATQRPSVNVITGMIKANFPARVAFRVMSKIDSRTILDAGGADQLIGRGDMLYTNGNDLIRIQCAFVDTPEVERITDFIGAQKAYATAHMLPEYQGEDGGATSLEDNIAERDKLFVQAAEVIVTAQQGSASLLQRKLKLGYNRAGRLIDQLEAAGIVGPFEGSKARQVLIPDLVSLEKFLSEE